MTFHTTSYASCRLCPRNCGIDRASGASGYCRCADKPLLAAAVIHRGEEPPLVTGAGSGTLFFAGCTLRCKTCQNGQISAGLMGRRISSTEIADICIAFEARGASNVNIVTGTHFAPSIVRGIQEARERGLTIPVVWNSSGYETLDTLRNLESIVDVWLVDIKSLDPTVTRNLFGASDYPERAREAIRSMTGASALRFKGDALVSGTIVRHLALPGLFDDSCDVINWFAKNVRDTALFSLMVQYLPPASEDAGIPDRYLTACEYEALLSRLPHNGIEDGYTQNLTDDGEWRPDFTRMNPFPAEFADPLWHWKSGFGYTADS